MLPLCARYCSPQDCLHNLQSPTQTNIWGPWMKKGETAVERTKILNIFLSSVVSLWTPPGVFIFYLKSLSLGHRDTPGGGASVDPARCPPVSARTPASQLLDSPHSTAAKPKRYALAEEGEAHNPTCRRPVAPRALLPLHQDKLGA